MSRNTSNHSRADTGIMRARMEGLRINRTKYTPRVYPVQKTKKYFNNIIL